MKVPVGEAFMRRRAVVGVERGADVLNKRKCEFGELCSFSCLCLHFFKEGVIDRDKKMRSECKREEKRWGRVGRRAGRQLLRLGCSWSVGT